MPSPSVDIRNATFKERRGRHAGAPAQWPTEALRRLHVPNSIGAPLFFFTTRDELRASDPLAHEWRDGNGRLVRLN